jgi:hypothetical protein
MRVRCTARYRYITVNGQQIGEHRHIMERHLGRKLSRREHVHHKNGDIHDNRIENLELLTAIEHHRLHSKSIPAFMPGHPPHRRRYS